MSAASTSGWQFSRRVLVPVVVAILTTIATVVAFITWSISRTDADALARQVTLLERALEDQITALPERQAELAIGDAALTAMAAYDTEWLNSNFGDIAFQSYGQSRVYLLDADGVPVYAMRDGDEVSALSFGTIRAQIAPLITQLHAPESLATIRNYNNFIRSAPPAVADVMSIDDQPAIVSVMPMLHSVSTDFPPLGLEPVYVAAMLLDRTVAIALESQYLFSNARFATDPSTSGSETAYPISDRNSQPVAWFIWTPERPGAGMLADTLPALLGALVVAGTIIIILMRNLQRASEQLWSERADAQHRAMHDPLTGLGNRALFQERLDTAARGLVSGGAALAVLALDLDHFKQVNDTLGHDAGDDLLCQVGARITATLRSTDTVARLGGDEFIIIQMGVNAAADAGRLAQRVIERLQMPFQLGADSVNIGVSIGIAIASGTNRDQTGLVKRADAALYQAKAGGRNRYCFDADNILPPGHPIALTEKVERAFKARDNS